jgi:hypothetical protein
MTRPRSLTTITADLFVDLDRAAGLHRRAQALGDAAQRRLQALALDGLGQVVDRLEVERLERVLGVRGDEDDRRRRATACAARRRAGCRRGPASGTSSSSRSQLPRRQPDQRLRGIRRLADDDGGRVAAFGDQALQAQPRELFVVDDEHA